MSRTAALERRKQMTYIKCKQQVGQTDRVMRSYSNGFKFTCPITSPSHRSDLWHLRGRGRKELEL